MSKQLERCLKAVGKINSRGMFEPKDIIAMPIVMRTKSVPSIFTMYRLIKSGKLKAVDLSAGKKPRYFVKGRDLKDFLAARYNAIYIK